MKGFFARIKYFLNSKTKPHFYNNAVEIPAAGEKIKIVPVGYFPAHHDGAHEVTKQNIQEMADNIKNSGTDVLFDYGHESIWNSSALAAGWSPKDSVEARADGLYIEYPEFTPSAKEKIEGREYRYFSPAYNLNSQNKQGKETGAILHSIALVNKPYMDKEINHIGNNSQINNGAQMNPQILKFLGLSENATEAEIETKLNSLRNKNGLPETASVDDIISAIETKKDSADPETQSIEQRVAALENNSKENQINLLINGAIADGKILPKQKLVFMNSAKTDFEATKTLIDGIAKNSAVPNHSQVDTNNTGATKLNSIKKATEYINQLYVKN